MGNLIVSQWTQKRCMRTLMIGLDNAGKTTILYRLKLDNFVQTTETLGFNNEIVKHNGLKLSIWDVGGHYFVRPLWEYYYSGVDAVIFVIDAADDSRLQEACQEFNNVYQHPLLKNAFFLIYANKMDLAGAIEPSELRKMLNVDDSRPWVIQPCSASSTEGLTIGIDWLTSEFGSKTSSVEEPGTSKSSKQFLEKNYKHINDVGKPHQSEIKLVKPQLTK